MKMTLQKDLSLLLGDPVRAKTLERIIFAQDRLRQQAYDYIVGIARKVGLGIVGTSILLLKYEDERKERIDAAGPDAGQPGREAWSARELFKTVSNYGDEYRISTRQDLTLLVAEVMLLGLKDMPANSQALAFVEKRRRETVEQLAEVEDDTAARFLGLKNHWLQRHVELRAAESSLGDLSRRAASIRHEFMRLFGREFLAARAQRRRMEVARRRLQLLRENPGINDADIERMLDRGETRQGSQPSKLQLLLPPAYCLNSSQGAMSVDEDFDRARSLLRSLARLTHPDKLSHLDPGSRQREQLEAIWQEMSTLRARCAEKHVLARAVPGLERYLRLAERILELARFTELDASLVIEGATISEQIRWLEDANRALDQKLRNTQADNLHLCDDTELREMQALVEAPRETQETERQAMVNDCEKFRKHAEALELKAARLAAAFA